MVLVVGPCLLFQICFLTCQSWRGWAFPQPLNACRYRVTFWEWAGSFHPPPLPPGTLRRHLSQPPLYSANSQNVAHCFQFDIRCIIIACPTVPPRTQVPAIWKTLVSLYPQRSTPGGVCKDPQGSHVNPCESRLLRPHRDYNLCSLSQRAVRLICGDCLFRLRSRVRLLRSGDGGCATPTGFYSDFRSMLLRLVTLADSFQLRVGWGMLGLPRRSVNKFCQISLLQQTAGVQFVKLRKGVISETEVLRNGAG